MMTNEVLTFLSEGAVGIISMLILAVMGFGQTLRMIKIMGELVEEVCLFFVELFADILGGWSSSNNKGED